MISRPGLQPMDAEPAPAAMFAPQPSNDLEATGPLEPRPPTPFEEFELLEPVAARSVRHGAHEDTQRLDGSPSPGRLAHPGLPQVDQVGRYSLEQRLGQGGVGTVWLAYDTVLARQVAVKTLTIAAEAGQREALAARVLDEARAAARLSHPHIVTVHDAGVSPEGAYIAMELLRGKDLAELMRSGWRPSPEQAAMIVRRVADALGYAHSKGVIHRDIKPANIFMVGRTRPVVLDFGIARLLNRDHGGPALGSPYYAAPEQYDGRECDQRSDVYSLGVVLFELLTGQRPFQGNTLDEIRDAVRQGRPQRPTQIIPAVPLVLETLVMQAIDIDPAARPRSAGALARELRTWLATLPTTPGATPPQTPLTSSAEASPRGLHRTAPDPSARERAASAESSLPPAANPAPPADLAQPQRQIQAPASSPAARAGAAEAPGKPRLAMLPFLTVAALLGMLLLAGWLLLSRG